MSKAILLSMLIAGKLLLAAPQSQPFAQPLLFEPNQGQTQPQVTWLARGPGYRLYLTAHELTMVFQEQHSGQSNILRLKLLGSNPWTNISGLEPTGGVSNYLSALTAKGSTISAVPHYKRIIVSDIYKGVDLTFYSNGGQLEYDFVLHPYADPTQIQLAFGEKTLMRLDDRSGDLQLTTESGFSLRHGCPKVYQVAGNKSTTVAANYKLLGRGRAAFNLAHYNPRQPLVIDPTLTFALLREHGYANAVTTDKDGNLYMTGGAFDGYPVTDGSKWQSCASASFFGGFDTCYGSIFVTKVSPTGTVLFSTFVWVGEGRGIAVDSTGVYVTGVTTDPSRPFCCGAYLSYGTGLAIVKLTLSGEFVYLSGFGDSLSVTGQAIAVDSQQNIWVVGVTDKAGSGKNDVYVIEDNLSTGQFVAKTFGGANNDIGYGIAIDPHTNNVWLTGQTCSQDFPVTYKYYNTPGDCAAFLMELTPASGFGFTRQFSSILEGSATNVSGNAIAIDAVGEVVIVGQTYGGSFPVTQAAFQLLPASAGAQAFIAKYDTTGRYLSATLLGGSGDTFAEGVAVNGFGEVYVSGYTTSADFPGGTLVLNPNLRIGGLTAGFLSKLTSDLTQLFYTLQVGDQSQAVAVFEPMPTVIPARIHPSGIVSNVANQQIYAYVDRIDDDAQLVRLRNHWHPDEYINTESGMPQATPVGPGWWSAQWQLELQLSEYGDPPSTNVFWIHNRWKPDEYLNIESGNLQSTPIQPDWWSARWTLEQIPGTVLYRIRNVWQPDKCLNIESGTLTASEAGPGWWSSYWSLEHIY